MYSESGEKENSFFPVCRSFNTRIKTCLSIKFIFLETNSKSTSMDSFSTHPLYRVHNIDSAMSSMLSFYKKNFIVLFIVSLVMSLITQYISGMIDMGELQGISDPEVMVEKLRQYIGPMVIISLVSLLFSTIIHYYVIYSPLDSGISILSSVVRSLRYFIPYLIIMVLFAFAGSFALAVGLLAIVIGVLFAALYLATIYFFILPVLLVEGPGIANAISRSLVLSHRRFWSNFGWTAVFVVLILVVSIILSGLVLLPFSGSLLKILADPEIASPVTDLAKNPLYLVLSAAVNALTFPLFSIFAVILYFNALAGEQSTKTAEVEPYSDDNGGVSVNDLYARPEPDDMAGPEVSDEDGKKG